MDRTTTIVALKIDRFDDDGGVETKPAVIVDGETYRVVELRRGAVVPRRQSSSSSSSYHPSERAYWLRSELRGAIYGRVRRGTVLRRLDQPVCVSVDVEGSAVVEVGWMSTSVHVAIKEGALVNAGREPYQGGRRDAVPSGVCRRRETTEETQAGGGGTTRTTSVMDMEGRARPIPPADPTSSAPAGSVSLAETTRK